MSLLLLHHFSKHDSKQCFGVDRALQRGPESSAPRTPNHPQRRPPFGTVRTPFPIESFVAPRFASTKALSAKHDVLLQGALLTTPWGSDRYHLQRNYCLRLLETLLAGALYRELREVMRILTIFLEKTHRNPS